MILQSLFLQVPQLVFLRALQRVANHIFFNFFIYTCHILQSHNLSETVINDTPQSLKELRRNNIDRIILAYLNINSRRNKINFLTEFIGENINILYNLTNFVKVPTCYKNLH